VVPFPGRSRADSDITAQEQGINAATISRRVRTREQQEEPQPEAGPSATRAPPVDEEAPDAPEEEEAADEGPSRPTRRGRAVRLARFF
jgi:hypothetical protein